MKYYVEDSLSNFKFWSGAEERASLLNKEQFDYVEQELEEMESADGWSDTAINDIFWFEFDTICDWLGYKDEEHLREDISNDDIQEAEDWADNMSTDYDSLFEVANMNEDEYHVLNDDDEEDLDYDRATDDFMEWWNQKDDFEKVREYRKYL